MKKSSIYMDSTWVARIFTVVSIFLLIIFFIVTFVTYRSLNHINSNGVKTQAIIERIGVSGSSDNVNHDVYISFKDNSGKNQYVSINFYSSDMYVGKRLSIIYDPQNVNNVYFAGKGANVMNYFGSMVMFFLTLMFSFFAVLFNKLFKDGSKYKKYLLKNGSMAMAEIISVDFENSIKVNGRSPYVLRCRFTHSDGNAYEMKSSILRYDPMEFIQNNVVKFFYDPNDFSKYFVDVEGSMTNKMVYI